MAADPKAIEKLFPELASYTAEDYARIGTDMPVLMIAMTARTGSAHLSSGLASVIETAQPFELLNARIVLQVVKQQYGFDRFEQLLASIVDQSREYLVFKTVWMDFEYFADKVHLLFPNLRIIYLNRLDQDRQAVSLARAIITQEWHDGPGDRADTRMLPEVVEQQFNIQLLCGLRRHLENEKRQWEDYFAGRDIAPLRIFYEHFQNDQTRAGARILDYLGLPADRAERMQSEHQTVSDGVNDVWTARLRRYLDGNPAA